MSNRTRSRPTVEALEDRWCPTVSATVNNGILAVSGVVTTAGDTLTVKATAANTFEVDDGATAVATNLTGVTGVRVNLTSANDTVAVDLGGTTLSGSLRVNLGDGTNALTVGNGSVGGRLSVYGGGGTDTVTLGDGTKALTVGGRSSVDLGAASDDVLTVKSGVTFSDSLTAEDVNNVTLAAGARVADDLVLFGGNSGNSVDIEGKVGNDLFFGGGFWKGNQVTGSSLTLGATASVGHDVTFLSALFNAHGDTLTATAGSTVGHNLYYVGTNQADSVNLAGGIGGKLFLAEGNGNNTVTVAKTATIGVSASLLLGNGANTVTFDGTVGAAGGTGTTLTLRAGKGGDKVVLGADAHVNGSAQITLGAGANLLDVRDAAVVTGTLTAKGGGNAASKFRGSTQAGAHATLNVTGFPITDGTPNP